MAGILKKITDKANLKLLKAKNMIVVKKYVSEIKKLKDSFAGKRCFIIGNGPSLRPNDLDALKKAGEICFASNRVYHIYDKTSWRPDIYCVQDYKLICKSSDELNAIAAKHKFIGIVSFHKYPAVKGFIKLLLDTREFYPNRPEFSDDPTNRIYEGYTVTYMCIQIAAYLGFKEMVLLGVDHSYGKEKNPDGTVTHNSNTKDHFSEQDKADNLPELFKSTLAYEAARDYVEKHGIKIFNATRGGKLEVFERRTFEEIMEGKV
ncbi:MAG: DUF115 domain-containing protein, partial [Ruminococcus sp.]|nr:DUF115 domain-containing protein [Ruminococcus sp.]